MHACFIVLRMFMRRSRCLVLIAFLVVIHVLVYLYIANNPIADYKIFFRSSSSEFFTVVSKKFNEITSSSDVQDSLKLRYNIDFDKTSDKEIIIPGQYFEDETAPELMSYNPHLTISAILNHLTDDLDKNDISDLTIPYFHWSDYVNMSVLHPFMMNLTKERCLFLSVTLKNKLRDKKNDIKEVKYFCFDEQNKKDYDFDALNPPIDQQRLLKVMQNQKYSTGFHIFQYGGTSTSKFKILHSRAYLNEFMPSPLSLVLLLPPKPNNIGGVGQLSNTIQVRINQDINGFEPLIKTPLFKALKKDSDNSDLKIDSKKYLKTFLKKLDTKPEFQKLVEQHSNIPFEKHLTHEQFIDNHVEIKLMLDQQFSEKEITDIHLQNYKHAIDTCIETPYPLKYFYEATMVKKEKNFGLGEHYDWRFFDGLINYTEFQAPVLHGLIRAYLQLTDSYNFSTWIAHGTLLSWFWNGVAFPWDIDFDVQMPIQDLHGLCRKFNQSLTIDLGSPEGEGIRNGKYFLDCSTFIGTRVNGNGYNNIDARFIDIDNGLYIDITGLSLTNTPTPRRYNDDLPAELKLRKQDVTPLQRNEYLKVYNCKNNHFQTLGNLSPLRLTQYEGQLAYVPHGFKSSLVNEYGESSLLNMKYRTFSFIEKYQMWVFNKALLKYIRRTYKPRPGSLAKYRTGKDSEASIEEEFKSEKDYFNFLVQNHELLVEYLVTHEVTQHHKLEMSLINDGKSSKSLYFKNNKLKSKNKALRPSLMNYNRFVHDYDFETTNERLLNHVRSGDLLIEEPDRHIDSQDALPQAVNDVLEEIQLINEPQTSGVAAEAERHLKPVQIPPAALAPLPPLNENTP